MKLSELREALECALSFYFDDGKKLPGFETVKNAINSLPERGTVIIDSKGMTVVPFDVGDDVWPIHIQNKTWQIDKILNGEDGKSTRAMVALGIYIDPNVKVYRLVLLRDILFNTDPFTHYIIQDCFPTREAAEAECQRRNDANHHD